MRKKKKRKKGNEKVEKNRSILLKCENKTIIVMNCYRLQAGGMNYKMEQHTLPILTLIKIEWDLGGNEKEQKRFWW